MVDLQNLALDPLSALRNLPAVRQLASRAGLGTLRNDLLKLISAVVSDDFDFDRIKHLLNAAISDSPDDTVVWDQVYNAVTESTPPPRPIAFPIHQTPWLHNTSSFANPPEYRQGVDGVLKLELGPLYVGLRHFRETFFGGVAGLETASEAVFKKCVEGSNPLFTEG
ncbi:MAG: hypothetical protein M1839_004671 [Geoglossum umbratile]|nr:MAG: hypothetical protein M1839_004671 [Geoglossum umbratile]